MEYAKDSCKAISNYSDTKEAVIPQESFFISSTVHVRKRILPE